MMRSFTVTLHHSNNYGALLQAYALQRVQQEMGIDNVIFEYPYRDGFYSRVDLRSPKSAFSAIYHNYHKRLHKKEIIRRNESFKRFHAQRMKLSRVYASMDELRKDDIDADVLITGSDQVWRFSGNQEFIPARFLDFGRDSARRISYAASMEKPHYTDEQKEKVKGWLSRFQGISLREESARDYIEKITGFSAQRVLDPVFLPDRAEWERIAISPKEDEPYILCYQVQRCERMQEVVDTLKKRTGYKTIAVLPESKKYIKTDVSRFDVSPEEFLGLYQNASVVVTGSFHGTAFGYLFGKPTYSVVRSESASRITELAALFGLSDFCIGMNATIPPVERYDSSAVYQKIAAERKRSLLFLSNHLLTGNL